LHHLTVIGNAVYFLGNFTMIDGKPRSRLAGVDVQSNALLDFAPSIDGAVSALASDGCRLFFGGYFSSVDGIRRQGLAAFDLPARRLLDWSPSMPVDANFFDLYAAPDFVHVSGQFTKVGTAEAAGFAQFRATP
jgi:hypothetical protein